MVDSERIAWALIQAKIKKEPDKTETLLEKFQLQWCVNEVIATWDADAPK